jgi:hypothetical protein
MVIMRTRQDDVKIHAVSPVLTTGFSSVPTTVSSAARRSAWALYASCSTSTTISAASHEETHADTPHCDQHDATWSSCNVSCNAAKLALAMLVVGRKLISCQDVSLLKNSYKLFVRGTYPNNYIFHARASSL